MIGIIVAHYGSKMAVMFAVCKPGSPHVYIICVNGLVLVAQLNPLLPSESLMLRGITCEDMVRNDSPR